MSEKAEAVTYMTLIKERDELKAENERLTEWNLNAQSLNGLLELRHAAIQAENEQLKEHLKRVLDLDLDVASDEDRKVLEEIAALEGGDG